MAAATSQPIALPVHNDVDNDAHMANSSSYHSPGQFNPASYTRAFFGSPISWRPASFANRASSPPANGSPSQLLGALDPSEARSAKLSSSIDSDRGSLMHALMEREDEFCRNYTCCGLNLTDLHALVDHFEEAHVLVVDPAHPHAPSLLPNPSSQPSFPPSTASAPSFPSPHAFLPPSHPHSFDPADDMELDLDSSPASSSASSPPHTPPYPSPYSSALSSPYPSHAHANAHPYPHPLQTQNLPYVPPPYSTLSSQPSSACPSPVSAFDTTAVMPSRAAAPFAAYAPFGIVPGHDDNSAAVAHGERAVAPALLFGNPDAGASREAAGPQRQRSPRVKASSPQTAQPYPSTSTRFSSGASSPTSSHPTPSPAPSASASTPGASSSTARASTTLSRPASALLLSKPFRCPKPNCSKSYKQANGLKYHMTHGSCNFAPPKDLEALQALLVEKGLRTGEGGVGLEMEGGRGGLSEGEVREVEREAERRLRPFACGVGECQRRYKNMNGLRYHYQHSGDHGAIGLRLLASGQHECLQHHNSKARGSQAPPPPPPPSSTTLTPTPTAHASSQAQTEAHQQSQQWYGQHYAWQQQGQQQQQQAGYGQ